MNEIETEVHPVFATKLQLKPNFYQTDTTFTDVVTLAQILNFRIPSNPNKEEILRARIIRNNDEEKYLAIKLSNPGIHFNARFDTSFNDVDVRSFTNLLYVDVDKKDNPNINLQTLKQCLQQFPYIVAVWTSFGGKGLGILAMAEINSENEFNTAHDQIRENIMFNWDSELKWDTSVNSISRGCALSFDPDIWTNDNPEFFKFNREYIKAAKIEKSKTSIDNLAIDVDFLMMLQQTVIDEKKELRQKYFVTDWDGHPVQFAKFKFSPVDHMLVKHISRSVIKKYNHCEGNIAVCNEFITVAEYSISHKLKIKEGSRKRRISAVVKNYVYMNNSFFQGENRDNLIYTLIKFINDNFCFDRKGQQLCPLDNNKRKTNKAGEFDSLIKYIIDTHGEGKDFYAGKRRAFYSNEHFTKFIDGGGKKEKYIYHLLKQIRQLNTQARLKKYEQLLQKYTPVVDDLKIQTSINRICKLIADGEDIKYWTVRKNIDHLIVGGRSCKTPISNKQKKSILRTFPTGAPLPVKRSVSNTQSILDRAINTLLSTSSKITKSVISEHSGLSVRTIKYHWKKYSNQIENHNSKIKMNKNRFVNKIVYEMKIIYINPKIYLSEQKRILLDFNTYCKTA